MAIVQNQKMTEVDCRTTSLDIILLYTNYNKTQSFLVAKKCLENYPNLRDPYQLHNFSVICNAVFKAAELGFRKCIIQKDALVADHRILDIIEKCNLGLHSSEKFYRLDW